MSKFCGELGTISIVLVLAASTAGFGLSLDKEEALLVDPEELAIPGGTPPLDRYAEWTDWEAWTPSEEVKRAFPYYRMGHDHDGLVVYVAEFGRWDYRKWPEDKLNEFWKHFEQMVRFQERDAKLCGDQGTVSIVDFDGFELSHHASPSALKLALTMFTSFKRLSDAIKYGFYVNVNFSAETFISLSKPFFGDVLDKYDIFGTRIEKWKSLLLRKIPGDQLAPKLGGTNSKWKPLPLN